MDQEKLQKSYKESINIALIYLQGSVDELAKIGDLKDKMTEKELNLYAIMLETRIAYLLDLTHRSFSVVFDLFPDAHENLKNCYIIFKRFEKAGKLKPCECDYCKENPMDPKELEGVKTPEEVKADNEYLEKEKRDWEKRFEEALAAVEDKTSEEADAVREKFGKEFEELSKRLKERFPDKEASNE